MAYGTPAVACFLDWNCCYKSKAPQIIINTKWVENSSTTGDRTRAVRGMNSNQHVLNRVITR